MALRALVVLFVAVAAGASLRAERAPAQRPCTLIGCESGVTVKLGRLPARAAVAELCAAGRCRRTNVRPLRFVFVPVRKDVARSGPVSVRIRVFSRGGRLLLSRSRAVRLLRLQPNGPGCPPICYQRSLTLSDGRLRLGD